MFIPFAYITAKKSIRDYLIYGDLQEQFETPIGESRK